MNFSLKYFASRFIAIALVFVISGNYAFPQIVNETLDKIVAIVGNEIITKSDVDGRLAMLKQQNTSIDISDTNVWNQVLDALINENLVITKAIEDSITVTDDEINQEWDRFKERAVQYYGSIKRLEDIYGMSFTRIQYEYRDNAKKQLLGQKIQAQKFGNVKITPHEVEVFFEANKDSMPTIPAQVELYHIVKYIKANDKVKDEIYELAKKVRDSIMNGGLFSDFAKCHSQDPGTCTEGGELGWTAKGKLLPEYEKAAFELATGGTSMPIETPFGYHLIQTLDKNKDSVLTRHILFRFGQSNEDIERVKKELNIIKDSVEKGLDFEEVAKKYSDEKETKGFGGAIGRMTEDNLPLSFKEKILALPVGGVTDPISYNADPTKPALHIIYKKDYIEAHTPNLKEDFKIIEQRAISSKKMKLYEKWIDKLREDMYWEVK